MATRNENCQGSMGLHQNNYQSNRNNEKTIFEAFRHFKEQCITKWNNGITKSPSRNPNPQQKANDPEQNNDQSAQIAEEPSASGNPNTEVAVTLDDLPFYCKLIILSLLETTDICHLSMTSRHWCDVCRDDFLWRELLYRDMNKWNSIGSNSNPLLPRPELPESHEKISPDCILNFHQQLSKRENVNYKALYFHCAYQRQKNIGLIGVTPVIPIGSDFEPDESHIMQQSRTFPRFLRSLWVRLRAGNGEVIMLGPGMESQNTSKIFRRLLWARPDLLMTVRLLPGSQDGVGSGVELDFKGEKRFNLIALYSGNRRDRARRVGLERLQESNILEAVSMAEGLAPGAHDISSESAQESNPQFRLRESVLDFIKQRDQSCRLIYVVDATKDKSLHTLSYNTLELKAVINGLRCLESQKIEQPQATNEEVQPTQEANVSALSSIMHLTGLSSQQYGINRRPLLVLSCTANAAAPRISCMEIVATLDLSSVIDRPWYVQDITVDNLNGLEDGLIWLFKQL